MSPRTNNPRIGERRDETKMADESLRLSICDRFRRAIARKAEGDGSSRDLDRKVPGLALRKNVSWTLPIVAGVSSFSFVFGSRFLLLLLLLLHLFLLVLLLLSKPVDEALKKKRSSSFVNHGVVSSSFSCVFFYLHLPSCLMARLKVNGESVAWQLPALDVVVDVPPLGQRASLTTTRSAATLGVVGVVPVRSFSLFFFFLGSDEVRRFVVRCRFPLNKIVERIVKNRQK